MTARRFDVEQIRARNPIAEVIAAVVSLKKSGSEYVARCPFHDERTASFAVNPEKGTYNCFGCGCKGDVISFAGCNRVHPETKVSTGVLQQFVITANSGGSATSLAISPTLVASGATQNVTTTVADNSAVVKVGAGASETLDTSMVFHKNAFTFATADLVMPQGVDFSAREVLDGISMRIVRQYDITNDKFPCRVDVLYGYKAIRPSQACRIHADA